MLYLLNHYKTCFQYTKSKRFDYILINDEIKASFVIIKNTRFFGAYTFTIMNEVPTYVLCSLLIFMIHIEDYYNSQTIKQKRVMQKVPFT